MVNKLTLIGLFLLVSVGLALLFNTSPSDKDGHTVNMNATNKPEANKTTITWKGQEWNIRSDNPYNVSTKDIWVDPTGNLHMKLRNVSGNWYNTELESSYKYKFGTFKWTVSSPLLSIDKNAVASMYIYIDDSHGINIEATGWGDSSSNKLWYDIQPASSSGNSYNTITPTSPYLTATNVTYSFDWEPNYIHYIAKLSNGTTIAEWNYTNTSGIPLVSGTVIMSTWLSNGTPSDGKDIEVIYSDFNFTPSSVTTSGIQSGVYDNSNFTQPAIYWSESARQVGGQNGIVDLVVGQAQDNGLCFVPFPYNNGDPKGYIYSWVSEDQAEPYLKQLEKDGKKVILSIQPNKANVSEVIDLILSRYGNHKNILGINIDCEWKNTGTAQRVSDAERDMWVAKIHNYNSEYMLFLTNYFDYTYFPSDNDNIVVMFDAEGKSQADILSDYGQLATHFTTVGLYTGFPSNTPPTVNDSYIIAAANNTKYILHNTWTINGQTLSSNNSIMPGLWGCVYDSSTGNSIGSAVIRVYNETWSATYMTSQSGEYWITGVDPGAYMVQAMASGYYTDSVTSINFTGVSVREDIAMKP